MLQGVFQVAVQVERIIGGEALAFVGGFDLRQRDIDPVGRLRRCAREDQQQLAGEEAEKS